MKDWRCLRYDGLRCFFRHEAGRWGCGSCGRVGFWLKAGLRFNQRFLCPGSPKPAVPCERVKCGLTMSDAEDVVCETCGEDAARGNISCWWCGAPGAVLGAEEGFPELAGCYPDCRRDEDGTPIPYSAGGNEEVPKDG